MSNNTLFKSKEALLSKGEIKLRADLLEIAESGIRKVIPYESTKALVRRTQDGVAVGDALYPWNDIRNIYIIGAGKGSFPIAQALDEILGDRISEGIVVVKEGEKRRLPHVEIFESSHPIPDERSITGADKIMRILEKAGQKDLVFAAITGGSSALVNKPAPGITIEELKELNRLLLRSGAEIGKVNAVRKHLCMMKGGRVLQYGQPATVVTLTFDTAPPDMPWPDMCLPDPTTFADAIGVLKSYGLWENTRQSVRDRLTYGLAHPEEETLKSSDGMKHAMYSVADPQSACMAAADKAREMGYTPYILSTTMEGEAKDVGIMQAGIVNEIVKYGRPFTPPCAIISGGETTVTILGEPGEGGPNQETVLGFASKLLPKQGVAFLSIDTDGTDGPGLIAGGMVDTQTLSRLHQLGIDLNETFQAHSSSVVLRELGDEIVTGHTGTNVMNLRVALIG